MSCVLVALPNVWLFLKPYLYRLRLHHTASATRFSTYTCIADQLLFDPSALECVGLSGLPVRGSPTGYALIEAALAAQRLVTFFGEVS